MSLCRQGAPLPGLEVHDMIAGPGDVALPMLFQHALAAFAQERERYAEAGVGLLGPCDRLKKQVDWHATFQACELRRDVGQATRLRRDAEMLDELVEPAQDGRDGIHGLGGR